MTIHSGSVQLQYAKMGAWSGTWVQNSPKSIKNVDERYEKTDEWCLALVFHRLFHHSCIRLSVMVCFSTIEQSKRHRMNPNKKKEEQSSIAGDVADLVADIVEIASDAASTVVDHGCSAGARIVESMCDIGSFLD